MDKDKYKYIGKGIYTLSEASQLTNVSWARIRHWIRGDLRKPDGNRLPQFPIIKSDIGKIDGIYSLSFLDLLEILTMDAIRKAGVSPRSIRLIHKNACDIFNCTHPFALHKFWTNGKSAWTDICEETHEEALLELKHKQFELPNVTKLFLESVDLSSDDGSPLRWWPMNRNNDVVIDPGRGFGQPIVNREGVPTIILANAVIAENSVMKAARWYNVSIDSVESAYKYEREITKRLAA